MLKVYVADTIFWGLTAEGFLIGPDGFEGWSSGVGMRVNKVEKPVSVGDFPKRPRAGSRIISLSGTCLAESVGQLENFGDLFRGIGSDGELVPVTVDVNGRALSAEGYLEGVPECTQRGGHPEASVDLSLWFPNPVKYGDERTDVSPSGVDFPVYHMGNTGAVPRFSISGDMPGGYALNAGPYQYRVTIPLVPGSAHYIDMRTGRLVISGVVQTSGVTRADIWKIPKYVPLNHNLMPISGGTANIRWTLRDEVL